jgi:hypothetical protein
LARPPSRKLRSVVAQSIRRSDELWPSVAVVWVDFCHGGRHDHHATVCWRPGISRKPDAGRAGCHEATFAAQAYAVNKDLGWDTSKVNVNGGAKKVLATLCIGGGMGIAMCIARN